LSSIYLALDITQAQIEFRVGKNQVRLGLEFKLYICLKPIYSKLVVAEFDLTTNAKVERKSKRRRQNSTQQHQQLI